MCFTENFWRLTVSGFPTAGFIYAIIAIGYTMVYGVLRLINFAHSEVFMIGGFASYFVMNAVVHGQHARDRFCRLDRHRDRRRRLRRRCRGVHARARRLSTAASPASA